MAACLLRNTVLRSAFIRSLQKAETLSCYSTATDASVDEFKFKYLDDGNASFQKLLFISFLDSAKDCIIWAPPQRTVFGVSVQIRLKPVGSITETC